VALNQKKSVQMKKARMPFQVLSLDGELLVEEEKDLQARFEERGYTREQRTKAVKRRCWHAHQEAYNTSRKIKNNSVHGKYLAARRKARAARHEWMFTEEQWQQMWIDAGWIAIPGSYTFTKEGSVKRPAFYLRGGNRYDNTYMARHDPTKPWCVENCYIGFRGVPLQESPYHVTA